MAGSNPDASSGGLNIHDRDKEDYDVAKRQPQNHHHHKETHGLRDDIGEETPISDVKAPNVFERAKEEIEAIVQAIHPKKEAEAENHASSCHGESRNSAGEVELKADNSASHSEKKNKSHNLIERAKEDIEALIHKQKSPHRHHKETHGTSDDIDENTPVSEVKGPNVFERAKEEFEAVFEAIHPKKAKSSPKKEGGLGMCIGKGLEKICSPGSHKRD